MKTNKKRGNVFIAIGILVLIIVFFATFLVYYQVNILIQNVRKDLYYASNNAILSFDTQELSYRNYIVDAEKTKEVIEYILNKNYTETGGSITEIAITDLNIQYIQDNVVITTQIRVKFKSVINLMGENEHGFKMNESIKISLMDYKEEKYE